MGQKAEALNTCTQGLKQTKKTEDKYNYGKGLVSLGEIYSADEIFDKEVN